MTSVDALAVGLSLALLGVTIPLPSSIIGLPAAAFAIAGVHLGHRLGHHLKKRAEVVGGLGLTLPGPLARAGRSTGRLAGEVLYFGHRGAVAYPAASGVPTDARRTDTR